MLANAIEAITIYLVVFMKMPLTDGQKQQLKKFKKFLKKRPALYTKEIFVEEVQNSSLSEVEDPKNVCRASSLYSSKFTEFEPFDYWAEGYVDSTGLLAPFVTLSNTLHEGRESGHEAERLRLNALGPKSVDK